MRRASRRLSERRYSAFILSEQYWSDPGGLHRHAGYGVAPARIACPAQGAHLKCVGRTWRQTINGDGTNDRDRTKSPRLSPESRPSTLNRRFYTHVFNRGRLGVLNPADIVRPDAGIARLQPLSGLLFSLVWRHAQSRVKITLLHLASRNGQDLN